MPSNPGGRIVPSPELRRRGMKRLSAVTTGVGVASVLAAGAVATALPGSAHATTVAVGGTSAHASSGTASQSSSRASSSGGSRSGSSSGSSGASSGSSGSGSSSSGTAHATSGAS